MTAPLYGDILERSRRRLAGDTPRGAYDDILERSAARRREQDQTAQTAAIARARTIMKPTVAMPMDRAPETAVPPAPRATPVPGADRFPGQGGGSSWDDGTGFLRNLGRSAYDAAVPGFAERAGSALQTVADLVPSGGALGPEAGMVRGAADLVQRGGAALEEWGGARRTQPGRVTSLSEALESWANARDFLGHTLGQGLGSSAPVLAGGLVGGLPAAAGISYAQQVGEVGQELDDIAPTMDRTRRAAGTLALAAPLAALDMATEVGAASGIKKAVTGQLSEMLAERSVGDAARNVVVSGLRGAASEGVTEALQEGGQYAGTRRLAGQDIDLATLLERAGEAAVAGALPGAVMGGSRQGFEEGLGALRRRSIGETTMEPAAQGPLRALPGEVPPDFEVTDDPTPSAPPRPGNVPTAPAPAAAPVAGLATAPEVAAPETAPETAPAMSGFSAPTAPTEIPAMGVAAEPMAEPEPAWDSPFAVPPDLMPTTLTDALEQAAAPPDSRSAVQIPMARTAGGRLVNNFARVSDEGLLDELETLTTRLQTDQGQSIYNYVEADVSGTQAGLVIPTATRKGGGPSMQAKAAQRVRQTQGVIDRLVTELEGRGVDIADALWRRAEANNVPLEDGATDFDFGMPWAMEPAAAPTPEFAKFEISKSPAVAPAEESGTLPVPEVPGVGPSLAHAPIPTDRPDGPAAVSDPVLRTGADSRVAPLVDSGRAAGVAAVFPRSGVPAAPVGTDSSTPGAVADAAPGSVVPAAAAGHPGAGLAPSGTSARPTREQVARENYRRPLRDFTPVAYREMSPEAAMGMIEGQHGGGIGGDSTFLATSRELALGQGTNKGVVVELDTSDLQGQVNVDKPAWGMGYDRGDFELRATHNTGDQYQRAIRSVAISPSARVPNYLRRRMELLTGMGWSKEVDVDGTTTYRPPSTIPDAVTESAEMPSDVTAAAPSGEPAPVTVAGAEPDGVTAAAPDLPATLARMSDSLEAITARLDAMSPNATPATGSPVVESETSAAVAEPEASTEELGTVDGERFAYTDPMAAAIGETVRVLKQKMTQREEATRPLYESSWSEVEARVRTAQNGLPTLGLRDRIRGVVQKMAKDTRHFRELDATRDGEHALMYELLLTAERSGTVAQARAADDLLKIVQGLKANEVQLMTRQLAFNDIAKDIEAGLYDRGNPVPFVGHDANGNVLSVREASERVQAELAGIGAAVAQHPNVAAAIERRATFAHALTTKLVEHDLLPEAVLEDPRYFHRQVLAAAEKRLQQQAGLHTGAGSPKDMRQRRRGFQKGRTGGGDFNLAYVEAEYEWVAQAHQSIFLAEALETVKRFDRTPQLKAQAQQLNVQRFQELMAEQAEAAAENGEEFKNPLAVFGQRIAMAKAQLTRLATRGQLDVAPKFQPMVARWLEAEQSGERFADPLWFPFLSTLLQQNGDGAVAAATIYKAIRERQQFIRETLGSEYIDPANPEALLELAGDGMALWQPEKGQIFYSALTVTEKEMSQLMAGTIEGDQLKRVMAMGGNKPTWILPEGIVATLNNVGAPKSPTSIADAALMASTRAWKQWTLLNPTRVIKYNLNNITGDMDAAMLEPGVLRHFTQAATDLWNYQIRRDVNAPVTEELQEAARRGIIGQTQTAAEIPDIKALADFKHLAAMPNQSFMAMMAAGYWNNVREFTQWRENVLRLAAWRYYRAEVKAGRKPLGASKRAVLEQLKNPEDRAAMLARDLVGDYGAISAAGVTMRDRFLPFYSWMEVNGKRYVNFARNMPHQETGAIGGAGRLAGAVAQRLGLSGLKMAANLGGKLVVGSTLAAGFMAMVAAWNAAMHPDEWDDLRRTGRDGHLVLGRTEGGDIITVRLEGAFADFLGWVGMKDLPSDIRGLVKDQVGYGDLLQDAMLAPVRKLLTGVTPTFQALVTLGTGKSFFPDPLNPRTVRDPLVTPFGALFDQWSLGMVYRRMVAPAFGAGPEPQPVGNALLGLIAYQTDAGQLAYDATRSMGYEWQEKATGEKGGGGSPTKRSTALFYFRRSVKYGEDEAAQAWLERYFSAGGTREMALKAIDDSEPLDMIPKRDRGAFLASRTPQERDVIARGQRWYVQQFRSGAGSAVRSTPRRAGPARPDSSRPSPLSLSWYLEQAAGGNNRRN